MVKKSEYGYCPEIRELFESRRIIGKSGKQFQNVSAISTRNNLNVLRNLLLDMKPARTLAVGMAFGGSSLVFLSIYRDLGREPNGQNIALDPLQIQIWNDAGLAIIEKSGLSGYLDFGLAFSALEMSHLCTECSSFGLIYIDGSHLFEDVIVDLYFSARLLDFNGIVLFDDCTNRHVAKVISFINGNLPGLCELDLSGYRADYGRSWKYRLGQVMGRKQLGAFQRVGEIERPWDANFRVF